ncbi:MAG: VacJ family lipoprotein [Burkholderiales bacterium]|nr:VacJ family lipoprotein [Burkholderiales bacterium]
MLAALLAATLVLGGCASAPKQGEIDDPFEPFNRTMYAINEPLDKYVARPVAEAYVQIFPDFVRQAVTNYVNNIDDLFSALNGLLQGKLDKAGHDMGRVMINTAFGFGGLIDIASSGDIPRGMEDFGQTFGYWGMPQGPYLFVPLWGPTTVRDGTGELLRLVWSPTNEIPNVAARNVVYGFAAVNARANALDATALIEQAAIDPYTFVRRSYLQRREYLVYDGKPPPPKDDD